MVPPDWLLNDQVVDLRDKLGGDTCKGIVRLLEERGDLPAAEKGPLLPLGFFFGVVSFCIGGGCLFLPAEKIFWRYPFC